MHTKQKLDYVPLMNNTKWDEIRLAMYSLPTPPEWRTKDLENGFISEWDREWFYHFKIGGYETIEWLEIRHTSLEQKEKIVMELSKIHVPLEVKEETLKIYGFVLPGLFIEYAKL
ncbi:hypothetical protein L5L78_22855 [Shewanella sp. SM34]|nr:hypothetical protein [Shewanella sp. SM34]